MFCAIDTDILAYKAASAAEVETDFGNDVWGIRSDLKEAKKLFQQQLDDITSHLGIKDYVCCLSDHSNNFRKEIHSQYKANRAGTRKPVGYRALCDWIEENHPTFRRNSLEADDCLGLLSTKPENKGQVVVVSDDKDMLCLPTKVYRPTSGEHHDLSEQDADRNFYMQTLTGDAVDNYVGIKGCGPKTAEKILGERPDWSLVEKAYIKAGLTRDDAITQARLARILRWSDWDEEKGEVKLWTPPTI